MLSDILSGFAGAMELQVFLLIFLGTVMGIVVGALPGVSGATGMALLLPLTFTLEPIPSIAMLSAMYCAAVFGGSISAILINTPGTPSASVTGLDGYPLTKKGYAGKALGMACISSSLGGNFSVIVLVFLAPKLAKIAVQFGAPEYFSLTLFALSMVVLFGMSSNIKALIAMLIGIMLSLIGTDPISGYSRFSFGNPNLSGGIGFIPVIIGLFAVSEAFTQSLKIFHITTTETKIASMLPSLKEVLETKITMMRSALIGVFIGILPAAGGTIAAFISYGAAKRGSNHPEKFGTGILEGIVAAETANNAATGGAMVPTLALGIPGSGATAIILGALMIQGLRPGPLLFVQQPKLVYTVFAGMFIANILFLVLGLLGARLFAQITRVSPKILNPLILLLCITGAYSINRNIFDVWTVLILGLLGYEMKRRGFPAPALVLGVLLGEILEINLRLSLMSFSNNPLIFLYRPWSVLFLALFILQVLQSIKAKHR